MSIAATDSEVQKVMKVQANGMAIVALSVDETSEFEDATNSSPTQKAIRLRKRR